MNQRGQALLFTCIVIVSLVLVAPKQRTPRGSIIHQPLALSSVAVESAPLTANPTQPHNPLEPPAIKTNSALAKIASGTQIFFESNPDQRWPIASLTKLMTATVALEQVSATREQVNRMKRMIVVSDNDAADALATELGVDVFVAHMNKKARALEMRNTGFSDPTGLSYLNQSTVRDLDKLIRYILEFHPEIFQWSREKKLLLDGVLYTNINEFAGRPHFLGGKTGYTDEANGNLISLFATSQGPISIIVLGTPNKEERFKQTEEIFTWISQRFKL